MPLLVAVGLLAVMIAYFWPVVFLGRALLPTDAIFYYDPVWKSFAREGGGPSNEVLLDIVAQFYPYIAFNQQAIQQHIFPLWNPYYLCGHPYLASFQPALLFPLNWVFFWDAKLGWGLTAIFRLWLAAMFSYAYLREIKLTRWGALAGALTFSLSGYFIVRLNYTMANVQMWLPLLLLLAERMIKQPHLKWVPLVAAVFGVQFFAGHPESSYALGLVWGLYVLYRLVSSGRLVGGLRSWFKPGFLLALAAIIGLLIACVQLVPFVTLLENSATMQNRTDLLAAEDWSPSPPLATVGRHLLGGLNALLPNFFGTSLDGTFWTPLLDTKNYLFKVNYFSQTRYLGLIALWLAGVGLVTRWRDRPAAFWGVLAVVSLTLDLRLPLISYLFEIPPFSLAGGTLSPSMYMVATAFLAGFGVDTLARRPRLVRRSWLGLAGLCLATLSAALLMYWAVRVWQVDLGLQHQLDHEAMLGLYRPFSWRLYFPLAFAGAALGLVGLYAWRPATRPVVLSALILLIAAESYAFGWDFNPTLPPDQVFPEADAVRFLRENAGFQRVNGLTLALKPNSSLVFELYDIGGYEDLAPSRYRRFMWNQIRAWTRQEGTLMLAAEADRLLDLTSVKYVVVPYARMTGTLGAGYRQVYQDSGVSIYENLDVLPRAYVVHQVETTPDEQASLARVYAPDLDIHTCAVIENNGGTAGLADPSPCVAAGGGQQPGTVADSAQITRDAFQDLDVQAHLAQDGYLVVTDRFDPDWQAFVDGQPAPILMANDVFRAVPLAAGDHVVTFHYKPRAVQLGLYLTLLGLGLLLGIALAAILISRRQKARGQ